jgi:hypothetical protein
MNEKHVLTTAHTVRTGNRRSFLKSAGALVLAAPAALASTSRTRPETSEWWHCRDGVQLLAEGVIPDIEVDPAIPWVLPPMDVDPVTPGIQPPPIPPGFEVRLRASFPVGGTKNLLAVQIYVVPQGLPLPLPEAPEPDPALGTISYYQMEVEDVRLGTSPVPGAGFRLPSFVLSGKAISNPVPSPFGDLTGAPCMVSASYQITDPTAGSTAFVMLGAACAGNHASLAPAGNGTLMLKH